MHEIASEFNAPPTGIAKTRFEKSYERLGNFVEPYRALPRARPWRFP